ncbi:sugar phosphate nucleotidyltransferase [Pontibacter liquoris]|uniref:sugar phosphate nucleotidyltransferase n=1 Tax=Pontibacter liquoris TaxID=2905677 RepID=UPI001FA7CA9B|nr:sugar phosphate nucleotidyltransferase [Pontibacter liquoris]
MIYSKRIEERIISPNATILDALKQMDVLDKKLLLIVSNEKFISIVSAGDIQRAIIKKIDLDTPISTILREHIRVASPDDTMHTIEKLMLSFRMEFCPVVNEDKDLLDVHFWEDIFKDAKPKPAFQFDLPVVVMAGGFGTRLKPLTNVVPKPLIPIGDGTMLEEIFSRFNSHGVNDFFLSVNYKASLIKFYLKELNLPYNIQFIKEDEPRGTAGSLSLLKGKIDRTFFVTNCDIIIDQDYSDILKYHRDNKNELTIIAALKHYQIPYGTLETGDNGELLEIREKPNQSVWINTGMYILEADLINEIPEKGFFHITELIGNLKKENRKIGVYPVSEGSWMDTGEWQEYDKTVKRLMDK